MSDERTYATGGYLPEGWVYEVQGGCIVPPYGSASHPLLAQLTRWDGARIDFGPPMPKLALMYDGEDPFPAVRRFYPREPEPPAAADVASGRDVGAEGAARDGLENT